MKNDSNCNKTDNHNDLQRLDPPYCVIRSIFILIGPMIFSNILSLGLMTITGSFVGRRLGPERFAHFMLGSCIFNMFGLSFGYGLIGAMDTLVSQAYGRSKQATAEIGENIQRAMLLCTILAPWVASLFIWGGPLFRVLFGTELGNGCLLFTRNSVPNFIIGLQIRILEKTLQGINKAYLCTIGVAISTVAGAILNYLYTFSVPSAVYVMTGSNAILCAVLTGCCLFAPSVTFVKAARWPSRRVFTDMEGMVTFMRIGIPSLIGCCAEWWAFEVLNIIAAYISVEAVAGINVYLSIATALFSVGLSVSVAVSVRVGNALGVGRPALTKQVIMYGLLINQGFNILVAIIFLLFRMQIYSIFTKDDKLKVILSPGSIVLALEVIGDSTQFCLQSIYRGAGLQRQSAKVVVFALWCVGLPLSFVWGKWMDLGAAGVLFGLVCGYCAEIPALVWLMVRRLDWEALAAKASRKKVPAKPSSADYSPKVVNAADGPTLTIGTESGAWAAGAVMVMQTEEASRVYDENEECESLHASFATSFVIAKSIITIDQ